MKKVVRWLYIIVICGLLGFSTLSMTGCWETFTAGFASGAITAESVLAQAEEALAENIKKLDEKNAELEQKNIELEQLLEQTESLQEKAKIRQMIADNEELKRGNEELKGELSTGKVIAQVGQQGAKTNWNNPTQVSAFAALVISLVMNRLQDRENKKKGREILGLNKGIQRFEGTHDKAVAGELHDDIKKEKRKVATGETA